MKSKLLLAFICLGMLFQGFAGAEKKFPGAINDVPCWYVKVDDSHVALKNADTVPNQTAFPNMAQVKGDWTLPDQFDGFGLVSVGENAFRGCLLRSIVIPEGVTEIGPSAFRDCTNLVSVTFPTTIQTISSNAFLNCQSLTNLQINASNDLSIGSHAFSGAQNLRHVSLSATGDMELADVFVSLNEESVYYSACANIFDVALNGRTVLCRGTFYGPGNLGNGKLESLTNCVVSARSVSLTDSCFAMCSNLKDFLVTATNCVLGSSCFYGCTSLRDVRLVRGCVEVGESAFGRCTALKSLKLPDGTTQIGRAAFGGCTSLEQIDIPASVAKVAEYAFSSDSTTGEASPCEALTNVVFKEATTWGQVATTVVGASAFAQCTGLAAVAFSTNVVTLETSAFAGCTSLKKVDIPDSVQGIGEKAFASCSSLECVEFLEPHSGGALDTKIGASAFVGCSSLAQVHFSSNVVEIGDSAFNGCSALVSAEMPPRLRTIGQMAFYYCSHYASPLEFPQSVSTIGDYAFFYCASVPRVEFKEPLAGTLDIGSFAFCFCKSVKKLKLPKGLDQFRNGAFSRCSALTEVELPQTMTMLTNSAFAYCEQLSKINLPTNLTYIGESVFTSCGSLKTFTIPSSVTFIGNEAFLDTKYWIDCPDNSIVAKDGYVLGVKGTLSSNVIIPEGTKLLPDGLFDGCDSVTNVVLPSSLRVIGEGSLAGTGITSFVVPTNVIQIGERAFDGCTSLTKVTFTQPSQIKTIAPFTFRGTSLTNVVIPAGVTAIGESAFEECSSLQSVTLPTSLTSIATRGFAYCVVLEKINLSSSMTIGQNAFLGCDLLPYNANGQSIFWIVYDPNGGNGGAVSNACVLGASVTISSNLFVRSGWNFSGWAKKSDGESVYSPGQTVSNLVTTAGGIQTLFAVWDPTSDAITSEVVGDTTWYFVPDRTGAIICRMTSSSNYVTAVSSSLSGAVNIPSSLGGRTVTEIGPNAFSNCTKITSVQMPDTVTKLGARAFMGCSGLVSITLPESITFLPDSLLEGCSSLISIEIPWSVTEIGSRVFANCSSLETRVTIPEQVDTLGAEVFSGCSALKIVRYFGDCPESVDGALYAGAPKSLISGVLRVRSGWTSEVEIETTNSTSSTLTQTGSETNETDEVETSITTVQRLPSAWPEGSDSRQIYWLNDVSVYTVTLDCNGGSIKGKGTGYLYYVKGLKRPLGTLPEPVYTLISSDADDETGDEDTEEEDKESDLFFMGWYTARNGGTKVSEEMLVSSNLRFYAHWSTSKSGEEDGGTSSEWREDLGLDEDVDEVSLTSACVYDGYLYEEAGSNDFVVVGTVTLKVAKGRKTVEDGETNVTATATATVKRRGAKQMTLKGTIDASGEGVLTSKRTEDELAVTVTADGLLGSFGDAEISGARNRTKSSAQLDKLVLNAALARWSGNWMVVLQADEATGEGAAFAQDCFAALSVNVGTKGKTKVTGTLPDGTKVSATGTMIVGDGCACVPVLVPLYTGKTGGLAFLLWFCTDEEAPLQVCGVSAWDAARAKRPFSATLLSVGAGRAAGVTDAGSFSLAGDFDFDALTVTDDLLPSEIGFTVKGTRWSFPKADGVRFVRDEEEWSVTQDNGNPAALKLSFASKTGLFTGSFKVFGVTEAGKGKKVSAKVFGGCLEGVGYGSAFIKNVGSVPVTIE